MLVHSLRVGVTIPRQTAERKAEVNRNKLWLQTENIFAHAGTCR
jgi:hypothetical protein